MNCAFAYPLLSVVTCFESITVPAESFNVNVTVLPTTGLSPVSSVYISLAVTVIVSPGAYLGLSVYASTNFVL